MLLIANRFDGEKSICRPNMRTIMINDKILKINNLSLAKKKASPNYLEVDGIQLNEKFLWKNERWYLNMAHRIVIYLRHPRLFIFGTWMEEKKQSWTSSNLKTYHKSDWMPEQENKQKKYERNERVKAHIYSGSPYIRLKAISYRISFCQHIDNRTKFMLQHWNPSVRTM